jgi:hypothetical protein
MERKFIILTHYQIFIFYIFTMTDYAVWPVPIQDEL